MKLKSILTVTLLFVFVITLQSQEIVQAAEPIENSPIMKEQNIYQFKVTDLNGKEFDFASLKGKKIIIVNTASRCGFTPQYKELQEVYEKFKTKNLVIIGFPANNFGDQEPGTDKEIQSFCTLNYGVTFPMMSKVSVSGKDMCEIYQFLTKKSLNNFQDSIVKWNFQKYLINEKGNLEKVLGSAVKPNDASIIDWINAK